MSHSSLDTKNSSENQVSSSTSVTLGTALCDSATKVILLGSGELGKELVIELQRFGVEVMAVDRYENAPAMHVAHHKAVVNMLDGQAIRKLVEQYKPDFIIPEIEAIATDELVKLEAEGFNVVPTAKATQLTMNREGIRRLAGETLSLPTSPYSFAETFEEYTQALDKIGLPCVIKPVMSSSGKGQSTVKTADDIQASWDYAQEGGRTGAGKIIIEGFVDFDYEITLLTVKAVDGIHFCAPIGHRQEDGDYRESWQPQVMSETALKSAQDVAQKVVEALGGYGIYGVELFIKGDQVYFSEVSPRPHDTGLVTLASQNLSEFALHARAVLGLPIGSIKQFGPTASAVILPQGQSCNIQFSALEQALAYEHTQLRLFAKPEINGQRRLGVAISSAQSIDHAVEIAKKAASSVEVTLK